jgi:hypothetical protein
MVEAEAAEMAEAVACIGSIGVHRKSMEADGADGASGEYKVSEAIKAVRTRQNPLGQDGTCLGLLLLHVGPNSNIWGSGIYGTLHQCNQRGQ